MCCSVFFHTPEPLRLSSSVCAFSLIDVHTETIAEENPVALGRQISVRRRPSAVCVLNTTRTYILFSVGSNSLKTFLSSMICQDAFNGLIAFDIEWQVINEILISWWSNLQGSASTCSIPAALAHMKAACWFPAVLTDKLTGPCPKGQGFKNKCHSGEPSPRPAEMKESTPLGIPDQAKWSDWEKVYGRQWTPLWIGVSGMRSQTTFLCSSCALKTDCCRGCRTHRWRLDLEYLQHPLKKQ